MFLIGKCPFFCRLVLPNSTSRIFQLFRHVTWSGIAGILFAFFLLHCRGKLEAFTSKCLDFETQECLEDHVCPASLGTPGLVCSNSTECRAAYVELQGTVLPVECICGLPSPAEESACKVFRHIFHSKPCFSKLLHCNGMGRREGCWGRYHSRGKRCWGLEKWG